METIVAEAIRRIQWMVFKDIFLGNFFPEVERNIRQREFIDLVQGTMSVHEYIT